MIHYHGTPITPISALMELRGRHFCVSHARPSDVRRVHHIGQSVMLDNGAFSQWRRGHQPEWNSYYDWCDQWLSFATTWAVIPDVIDGGTEQQEALIAQWPFRTRGAPVWHMDESIDRLLRLVDAWPRVCIGSTAEYAVVLSDAWKVRMDECWNALSARHRHLPWVHMLRGMRCAGRVYPFASVDSTDVAQSHHDTQNTPDKLARRWDARQSPGVWHATPEQMELPA